ncbi:MAG: hypothetical protein WBL61_25795 [Bryobacteraceae bacterium]
MAQILGQNGIALLDGGSGDEQVVERQHVPFCRFLAFDLAHQVSRLKRDGMEGHQVDQFLDVSATTLAGLLRLGAIDPVRQFGHRDG